MQFAVYQKYIQHLIFYTIAYHIACILYILFCYIPAVDLNSPIAFCVSSIYFFYFDDFQLLFVFGNIYLNFCLIVPSCVWILIFITEETENYNYNKKPFVCTF